MEVSGDKARSILLRRNIVTERETAEALLRADAYLSTRPASAESEQGQVGYRHGEESRPDGRALLMTGE